MSPMSHKNMKLPQSQTYSFVTQDRQYLHGTSLTLTRQWRLRWLGLLLRPVPLRTGMVRQRECCLSLLVLGFQTVGWPPDKNPTTCALPAPPPTLAETKEDILSSHKLRSQDIKQDERRRSASCWVFSLWPTAKFVQTDTDLMRTINLAVYETSSNNRLLGPMFVFYPIILLLMTSDTKDRNEEKQWPSLGGRKSIKNKSIWKVLELLHPKN